MFNRVLQRQNPALALRLVADVAILLTHTHHHAVVSRTTNDGREHRLRGIIPGKPSLDHTGTVIAHERGDFAFIRHGD